MTGAEAIRLTRRHLEGQFPRSCTSCGRRFRSLQDYLRNTTHVGAPISYDAELGEYTPRDPVGTIALANCPCGTTLALGTAGMSLLTLWRLMAWGRGEVARRGIALEQLLVELRADIDAQVLADEEVVPPEADVTSQLRAWRESLVLLYLNGIAVVMPFVFTLWVALRPEPKFDRRLAVLVGCWFVTALVRVLAPRRWVVIAGFWALVMIGPATLPAVGLSPGPFLCMLTTCVLAAALYGPRPAFGLLAAYTAITVAVGGLAAKGGLAAGSLALVRADVFPNWIRIATVFALACAILVVGLSRLFRRLETAWLEQHAAALRAHRAFEAQRAAEERQRRVELAARSAQHLEAVGRLSSGIAHDFNNLLLIILMWADALEAEPGLDPREGLGEIRGAASQAAQLSRRLLSLAKKSKVAPRALVLDEVVAALTRSLQRLLPADIEVRHVRAPDGAPLPHALADESVVGQVLLNLAVNAADAMPGGGRLTLGVEYVDGSAPRGTLAGQADAAAEEEAPVPPGRWWVLRVVDTGVGMDAATCARAFEPFFSTKDADLGSGVGLASVRDVVTRAGGWIDLWSAPGAGARFRVGFPAAEALVAEAPRETAVPSLAGRTALLVEDDPTVRAALARALHATGLRVLEASSATEALALARRARTEVHVLCTDGVMPGEPTRVLVEGFRALFPGAPVLVCSGHDPEALGRKGLPMDAVEFLPKPFSASELHAVLARRVV